MLAEFNPKILEIKAKATELFKLNKKQEANTYYYDSIPNLIKDSYFDELKLKTLSGDSILIGNNSRPTFIQMTATWCRPCKQIKPVMKTLAEEYNEHIDFVLIYWDKENELIESSFNSIESTSTIPTINRDSIGNIVFGNFNHILGYPFNYFLDSNNKIISSGIASQGINEDMSSEETLSIIYPKLKSELELLLENP